MSILPTKREVDDKLVEMLTLRSEGWTSLEIGDLLGIRQEYVRAATNRVVDADAEHHNDIISFGGLTK